MKKIWKNLCACSMALACGVGLVACGDEDEKVSKDLDGDGIISSWETLFDQNIQHTGSAIGEITYIKNAEQLLDINNNIDTHKIYVLSADIDLNGKEVCINLGKSEFYGNNYVINNFKLGTADTTNLSKDNQYDDKVVKCLFYNGTGVYSTRVFMGMQTFNIDAATEDLYYSISPFFNIPAINGVEVKGKLEINAFRKDGRREVKLDASLLYSDMDTFVENEDSVENVKSVVNIDTVNVDGKIILNQEKNSMLRVNMGAIASEISKGSVIYNAYAQVDINSGISERESNVGGIVGHNKGFVSTCTYTGTINLNNNSNNYADKESVGGIVGLNDSLAEVKNCSTNATISCNNAEAEIASTCNYYFGGIVGINWGGILELSQSDANLQFSKLNKMTVGGFCGYNERGIISYGICRGSVTVQDVKDITLAQVVGLSNAGYLEKLAITTDLNVDNSQITSSNVDVGMVTVFDNIDKSPYFNKILVDGTTEIFTREFDNSTVNYQHGLRNQYQVLVGKDGDEDVYDTILPAIFNNVYKTSTCRFIKYSLVGDIKADDGINVKYVNSIGTSTNTPRWMMDYLDFKNHLNHNEVSLGDSLSLKDLYFTISDKSARMQSYFGYSQYNGELTYYDREFTQSYTHNESSLGSCENDTDDEMLSFLYGLINSNNGKSTEHYVIKINDTYLNKNPEEQETIVDGLSQNSYQFRTILENAFKCLSTTPNVTKLDANGTDLDLDESGTLDVKYLLFTFSDSKNNYSMKIDITNFETPSNVFEEEYIVYVTFSITSKIVV